MNILVTGGTGFIGAYYLAHYRPSGHIYATYRNRRGTADVTWISCDLSNAESLASLAKKVAPIDIIIHFGGASPNRGYADGHFNATTTSTAQLLRLAKTWKTRHFIFLSSISVEFNADGPYTTSKKEAERYIVQSSVPYSIIRPETVVGPGAKDFERTLALADRFKILPMIGLGNNRTQPVAIDDLCAQIARLVRQRRGSNEIVPSVGPESITLKNFMRRALREANIRALIIPVPKILIHTIAWITQRLAPKLGLNKERIHIITQDRVYLENVEPTPIAQMLQYLKKRS